jgi:hypothetical protein
MPIPIKKHSHKETFAKKNPQSSLRVSRGYLSADLTRTRSRSQKKREEGTQQEQAGSGAHCARGRVPRGAACRIDLRFVACIHCVRSKHRGFFLSINFSGRRMIDNDPK